MAVLELKSTNEFIRSPDEGLLTIYELELDAPNSYSVKKEDWSFVAPVVSKKATLAVKGASIRGQMLQKLQKDLRRWRLSVNCEGLCYLGREGADTFFNVEYCRLNDLFSWSDYVEDPDNQDHKFKEAIKTTWNRCDMGDGEVLLNYDEKEKKLEELEENVKEKEEELEKVKEEIQILQKKEKELNEVQNRLSSTQAELALSKQEVDMIGKKLKAAGAASGSLIKLGPWGGQDGSLWSFHTSKDEKIKEITIGHGFIVDSLTFVAEDARGCSRTWRFGGSGGGSSRIRIDPTRERIRAISGTHGNYKHGGGFLISSITFHTNFRTYGPYGTATDVHNNSHFSIPVEGGAVVGFHGRTVDNKYIKAVGVYANPDGTIV